MEKLKIYRPLYMRDFMCTGGACDFNCCNSWTVEVDEKSYRKYKKLKDIFRKKILNSITVSTDPTFKASITLSEDGNCPLLGDDGLCEIQKRLGHDYLSTTCKVYPRMYINPGDSIEEYLVPTCPEAAKLIMDNPEYITFEEDPGGVLHYDHDYVVKHLRHRNYTNSENGQEIFWVLRKTCIYIMQLRKYKLWLRFVILGLFMELISRDLSNMTADSADSVADEFISQLEQGMYDDLAGQLPESRDLKASFIQNSCALISKIKGTEVFSGEVAKTFGISEFGIDYQLLYDNYIKAYTAYYQPFFEDKEHLLENFFVNKMLYWGFPFTEKPGIDEYNIMKNYAHLVIDYGIIKHLLIGLCGYHKEDFTVGVLYDTISRIDRHTEHNRTFSKLVLKMIPDDMDSLVTALAMMIRD